MALVLVVDGIDYIATTTSDAAGIATAWAATDWDTVKPGLMIDGSIKEQVSLYDPAIETSSMKFTIVDVDDTLLGTMLRQGNTSAKKAGLSADVSASETTSINVTPLEQFATSGTIYIGLETITYTETDETSSKTSVFNGTITRGKFSIFKRQSGGNFSWGHRLAYNTDTQASYAPLVSNAPITWYNRQVALYMTHHNGAIWATAANARLLWAGRMKSWTDNGDGSLSIDCMSIHELLKQDCLTEQWQGTMSEGINFVDEMRDVVLKSEGVDDFFDVEQLTLTGGNGENLTWAALLNRINVAMDAADTTDAIETDWTMYSKPDGKVAWKVKRRTALTTNQYSNFSLGLHPSLWVLLGFEEQESAFNIEYTSNGRPVAYVTMHASSPLTSTIDTWEKTAKVKPAKYKAAAYIASGTSMRILPEITKGLWYDQDEFFPPTVGGFALGDANGMVDVDGMSFLADHSSSPETVLAKGVYSPTSKIVDPFNTVAALLNSKYFSTNKDSTVREGDDAPAPVFRQVWIERGNAGIILLRLMLSTGANYDSQGRTVAGGGSGTADYNATDYDVLPGTVGLAIPYDLVDVDSFLDIDVPLGIEFELALMKATKFEKILLPVLAALNRAIVFKDGKLTCVQMGFESQYNPGIVSLTESNKADAMNSADRTTVSHGIDGIVNRVTVKSWLLPKGEYRDSVTINDTVSMDDHKGTHGVTIEAGGILNVEDVIATTMTPALAYFSRPLAQLQRSFDHSQIGLTPGDVVAVTDNYMADQKTGTRGVTSAAAWVSATDFDLRTGIGRVTAVYLPEYDASKAALWAPTAAVDHTAASAGLISASTLRFLANKYSLASETTDVAQFAAGDIVRIVQLDAPTGEPLTWQRTIDSISSNDVTFTAAIATPTWDTTSGLRYVMEFDRIQDVVAGQLNCAFLADGTTQRTSGTDPLPYVWIPSPAPGQASLPTDWKSPLPRRYTTGVDLDGADEPLSVHKLSQLFDATNALLGYKTRGIIAADYYVQSDTANANQAVNVEKIVYGPFPAIFTGHRNVTDLPFGGEIGPVRKFVFRVLGNISSAGTATFKLYSSSTLPTGTAAPWTGFSSTNQSTGTVTSTTVAATVAWTSEGTCKPTLFEGPDGQQMTWLWITALSDNAARTATLKGVFIAEEALS